MMTIPTTINEYLLLKKIFWKGKIIILMQI